MTAQVREPIGPLQDSCRGLGAWIVGAGPTIDDVDLEKLRDEYILAVNAAYSLFDDDFRDCWWIYYDIRVYHEMRERAAKRRSVRAVCYKQPLEMMRELRNNGQYVEFFRTEFRPERTVVETALLIADFLGFDHAYLLGVDGFVPRDGRPYCQAIDKWKRCYFMDRAKPDSWEGSSRKVVEALAAVKEKLQHIQVFQLSPAFPDQELFERISFEEALERSEAKQDATIPRRAGQVL